MHVDEDLAEFSVLIFAGVDIDLVPADSRLLDIALAAVGQFAPRAVSLDYLFHDPFDGPSLRLPAARSRCRLGLDQIEQWSGRRCGSFQPDGAPAFPCGV